MFPSVNNRLPLTVEYDGFAALQGRNSLFATGNQIGRIEDGNQNAHRVAGIWSIALHAPNLPHDDQMAAPVPHDLIDQFANTHLSNRTSQLRIEENLTQPLSGTGADYLQAGRINRVQLDVAVRIGALQTVEQPVESCLNVRGALGKLLTKPGILRQHHHVTASLRQLAAETPLCMVS
ncbi:hypothetical protein SDC9_156179 [bioreactor metagenome]|uniref:Uncharacterized protein n=1 Tax=bioreactor metagenome TaxID=1076179 RepID=A0A645F3Q2_9ZZZZ